MSYQFWIPFIALLIAVTICERKWCMLRDLSKAKPQPYSWSKVQLAWWTVIILASFIAILWKSHVAPTLTDSALILLGISALTTTAARLIDVSDMEDEEKTGITRHQDERGKTFFLDILSDQNGISISRFQTVVFNLVFGIWFITKVVNRLSDITLGSSIELINDVMPPIEPNNLILLGLSSATYAALKMTENKAKKIETTSEVKTDSLDREPAEDLEPAVG